MAPTESNECKTNASSDTGWVVEPFLHVKPNCIYNPLTDQVLSENEPNYVLLGNLMNGKISVSDMPDIIRRDLESGGWIIPDSTNISQRFRLRYVSLETHTLCNQACYFCPVAVRPRKKHFMPMDLFETIVAQLTDYRGVLEGVCLNNYNEPTMDTRLIDQLALLDRHGIAAALLTNGSLLTPELSGRIRKIRMLKYLSVNLSTLDRERYRRQRRADHLGKVLRNLDYLADHRIAEKMEIVVLGTGDAKHLADKAEIEAYFASSNFDVKFYKVMNRAGHVDVGMKPEGRGARLCGCDQTGSRPLQWLHVTARGECVLCCQDYFSQYVIGNLEKQSVRNILDGKKIARLRGWIYGLEKAPEDFICNRCIYAQTKKEKHRFFK